MSEVERAVATAMGSPDDLTAARVLIAALRASGFVIVRKEPTAAIVAAGYGIPDPMPGDCWRAMIAAASKG